MLIRLIILSFLLFLNGCSLLNLVGIGSQDHEATDPTPAKRPAGIPTPLGNGDGYGITGTRFTWIDPKATDCASIRDVIVKTVDGKYYQLGSPCSGNEPVELPSAQVQSFGGRLGFQKGVYQKQ